MGWGTHRGQPYNLHSFTARYKSWWVMVYNSVLKVKNGRTKSRPILYHLYFYIYPVCFRIYRKIRRRDGKREGVYPTRICRILFFSPNNFVLVPYLLNPGKKAHPMYFVFLNINTCSSTSIHVLHVETRNIDHIFEK